MTDYVDRNKVLSGEEFFGEHATWDNPTTEGCFAVRSDFIMNLPAADVVEVVRCKDCKNRFNHYICAYRGDNWFCGYGERRSDNGI